MIFDFDIHVFNNSTANSLGTSLVENNFNISAPSDIQVFGNTSGTTGTTGTYTIEISESGADLTGNY